MTEEARTTRRFLSTSRVLGFVLTVTGCWIVALNAVDPDESRTIGWCVAAVGVAALAVPRRLRIGRTNLVVLASMVVAVFAAGEAWLRWTNGLEQQQYYKQVIHFVDDPELKYELQPNRLLISGGTTTNSLGMIDFPRTIENPAHALRVACLGDSVGGDAQVFPESVCPVLGKILGEARGSRPTEALNFSVVGYNTLQEARSLEIKAAPFSPDVVVVLYVLNDPFPDLAIASDLPGHLKFERKVYDAATDLLSRAPGGFTDPAPRRLFELHQNPRGWGPVVVRGFDRIQAFAQTRRIPVVVAIFPWFAPHRSEWLDQVYAKVAQEAQRHGFIPVNLSAEAFAGVDVETLLKPSRDPIHPNALAHHLAAEAIVKALLKARPELLTR
jgi:hypothetical protein